MAELPMADRHETVLPAAPADALERLHAAGGMPVGERKAALAAVVAGRPTLLEGWAQLAAVADAPIESYAYARVGYHRGLDALRAAGWAGRGYVRWSEPTNRGVLRCIAALRAAAERIDESAEVDRLDALLRDLDPDWNDADVEDLLD